MNNPDDQQLLCDYVERRSEAAFAELVRRHLDFVYSAALRMVRDTHLAEDVTQAVFVALAQNASRLTPRFVLSGWLHCTARNLAAKAVRTDARRRAREQEAATMNQLLSTETDISWQEIAPLLDAALGELSEADRDALLLRFFQRHSAREMAERLGISDEAAQKRVSRAIERLRDVFAKRGCKVGAGGLAILISANAVQSAPAGLTAAVLSTASAAVPIAGATTMKAIAMTTLQKTLVAATVTVLAGAGVYEAHQSSQLRETVNSLEQRQKSQAARIEQLQRDRDEARSLAASLKQEKDDWAKSESELLRLRGQVGVLSRENQRLAQATNAMNESSEPALKKGFGTLGDYLPAEGASDVGNATPEALLTTFVWAMREGRTDRLEQIGAPLMGQHEPGDVAGQISKQNAQMFAMIRNVFTNSAGFRLSSKPAAEGDTVKVRLDAVPLKDGTSGSDTNNFKLDTFNISFLLQRESNGWIFGAPEDSAK